MPLDRQHDAESHDPPLPLEYRDPREDRPDRVHAIAITIGSGFIAFVTVWVLVIVWDFFDSDWEYPVLITLGAAVFWIWLLSSRPKMRPLNVGALFGFGSAVLIVGVLWIVRKW